MEPHEEKAGFFSKNWRVILAVLGILLLVALFVLFSGKSVSPDLRYFPA